MLSLLGLVHQPPPPQAERRVLGYGLFPFRSLGATHPIHPPVERVVVGLHIAPSSFNKHLVGVGCVLPNPKTLVRVLPRLGQVFLFWEYAEEQQCGCDRVDKGELL